MEKKPAYVTGDESVGYLIECTDTRTDFRKGNGFEFTLILFGESIVFFNIYLQALYQLGMTGLGKDRARFSIREVSSAQGGTIVCGNEVDMSRYCIGTIRDYVSRRKEKLQSMDGDWSLLFLTPLSMKYRKEYMEQFYAESADALLLCRDGDGTSGICRISPDQAADSQPRKYEEIFRNAGFSYDAEGNHRESEF